MPERRTSPAIQSIGPMICFAHFTLDLSARRLLVDGQALTMGSRAFDLLAALVRQPGRPVSTHDLRLAVWGDRQVGDNNLRVQVSALRKLLGNHAIVHDPIHGYRFVIPVAPSTQAAAASVVVLAPCNLPPHAAPLFGRQMDLQQLGRLLDSQTRVTLVGPAGIGKTSLAQAVARDQRSRLPACTDGVWWVELATLLEPSLLAATVGQVLHIKTAGVDPMGELVAALAERCMLLVLDNAEHLVDAVAELADKLLTKAPGVALLATSRRPMKCAGEQVMRLGPLALPEAPGLDGARDSGAVMWFVARAQRADPGFALTPDNVDEVVAVCRQLDGVALAIGLAAARVPLLGVAGLHARLDDRLRLLTSREPDARGHPQALTAALDWSHGLLRPAEQTVLRRLGVFAGSFTLASVQAVVADGTLDDWAVLDALNALIDDSLLMPDAAVLQAGDLARYTLHETVRLYARTRLQASGEQPALRLRHAQHVLALLQPLPTAGEVRVDRMRPTLPDADHDNLRAAIHWALAHDFQLALALARDACTYMRLRAHHLEARRLAARLLADTRLGLYPLATGWYHANLVAIEFELNAFDTAMAHALAALQIAQAIPAAALIATAETWVSNIHIALRRPHLALPGLQRGLAYEQSVGDRYNAAIAQNNIGCVLSELGRFDDAEQVLLQALAEGRAIDRGWVVALSLENLGENAYVARDFAAAHGHWQQALPAFRALGHLYHQALVLAQLAQASRRLGQAAAAHLQAQESLRICLPQQFRGLVAGNLVLLAGLALDGNDPRRAGMLLRVAERERNGVPLIGPMQLDAQETSAAVRQALTDADWHVACAEGDLRSPAQAAAAGMPAAHDSVNAGPR